jgi:hypothetical protein
LRGTTLLICIWSNKYCRAIVVEARITQGQGNGETICIGTNHAGTGKVEQSGVGQMLPKCEQVTKESELKAVYNVDVYNVDAEKLVKKIGSESSSAHHGR